jgi:hypothetical protein
MRAVWRLFAKVPVNDGYVHVFVFELN